MTGALIAIAIFAALLALWAWSLCRIAALSDRRISPPPATDGGTNAAAGDPTPGSSAPRTAPMVPYERR